MANINDQVRQIFENAGVLTLTISASDFIILNTVPGSLSIEFGDRELVDQYDRGQISAPMETQQVPSTIDLQFYATKYASAGIHDKLMTASTNGFRFQFDTLKAQVPTYRGASTGTSATFTSPWRSAPLKLQTGRSEDMFTVQFKCAAAPTMAAY